MIRSVEIARITPNDFKEMIKIDRFGGQSKATHFRGWSKAIVNYSEYKGSGKRFVNMSEWREFSGLDRYTLIADPLYVDSAARDFRIDPISPNRRAGTEGMTIGALEN